MQDVQTSALVHTTCTKSCVSCVSKVIRQAKSSSRSHVAMAVWASLCVVLLAAAGVLLSPVTAKLSAAVVPSNSSPNGTDWCDALKPCNETKTNSAEIESSYGLGLLFKKTTDSSSYQYSSTTPATAVDWRTVLTNWAVRDQGSCGEFNFGVHQQVYTTLLQSIGTCLTTSAPCHT